MDAAHLYSTENTGSSSVTIGRCGYPRPVMDCDTGCTIRNHDIVVDNQSLCLLSLLARNNLSLSV